MTRAEANRARCTTHGLTNSPEYISYHGMKQRCYYRGHKDYAHYGGRGVAICDRWLASFSAFYADMGPRPPGHTLDRINPDGDYTPDNCRWAESFTQARNRRNTVKVWLPDIGRSATLKEAATHYGANYSSVRYAVKHGESTLGACQRLGAGIKRRPGPAGLTAAPPAPGSGPAAQ